MKLAYDPRAHGALCSRCPLDKKPTVPPNGPKNAVMLIVGEAPGYNEEREGVGFIGASGRLLDAVLQHHGVDRAKVFISNAALCKPPDLKIGAETSPDVKALKKALDCCRPRLINEVKSLKKLKVIVPLGASAVRALTGRKNLSILKARGFVWDPPTEKIGKGKKAQLVPITSAVMVPSVHPAFALRAPAWEVVLSSDFERALRASTGSLRIPRAKMVLAPEFEKIDGVLAKLGETVAVDVETTKATPTTCDLLCVGISDGKLAVVIPWARTKSPRTPYYGRFQGSVAVKIRNALKQRTSITHNGPGFDQIVLARYGIDLAS